MSAFKLSLCIATEDVDFDSVSRNVEGYSITRNVTMDDCNYQGDTKGNPREMTVFRLVRRNGYVTQLDENDFGPKQGEIYFLYRSGASFRDGGGECAIGPVTLNDTSGNYGILIQDFEYNQVYCHMESHHVDEPYDFGGGFGVEASDINDVLCYVAFPNYLFGCAYRDTNSSIQDFKLNAGIYTITCKEAGWAASTPSSSWSGVRDETYHIKANQGFGMLRTDYTFPIAGNVLANTGWKADGTQVFYWCEDNTTPGQVDPLWMATDMSYVKEKTGDVSKGVLPGYTVGIPGYATKELALAGTKGQKLEGVEIAEGMYRIFPLDSPRYDNAGGALFEFARTELLP